MRTHRSTGPSATKRCRSWGGPTRWGGSSRRGKACAGDHTAGVVVLSGDPGVGKTRVAAEIAVRAAGDGALVLAGRCVPGLGVSALFEQTTTLGYPPPRTDGSGTWASPLEYGAAIFERLGHEATVRPMLIVLDDLHHVDPLTCHLLGGLVDRPLPVARPWPLLRPGHPP